MITPEVKAVMTQMKADGVSVRQIAAQVGFSKSAVQKVFDAAKGDA
jgi:transposase